MNRKYLVRADIRDGKKRLIEHIELVLNDNARMFKTPKDFCVYLTTSGKPLLRAALNESRISIQRGYEEIDFEIVKFKTYENYDDYTLTEQKRLPFLVTNYINEVKTTL